METSPFYFQGPPTYLPCRNAPSDHGGFMPFSLLWAAGLEVGVMLAERK